MMVGDNSLIVAPAVLKCAEAGLGPYSIALLSTGSRANFFRAAYPALDCPTLLTYVAPFLYQPMPPSQAVMVAGTVIDLSNYTFALDATNAVNGDAGSFQITLFIENFDQSVSAPYGAYDVTWSKAGGITTSNIVNNTTYGPTITIGDDVSGVGYVTLSPNNFVGFFPTGNIDFRLSVPSIVMTGNSEAWLAAVVPECAYTPIGLSNLVGFSIAFPLTPEDNALGVTIPPLNTRSDLVNHAKSMNIFSFLK